MAGPWAEQWEIAEELHMMQCPPPQCHDRKESCINSLHSSDHFTLQDYNYHPYCLAMKHAHELVCIQDIVSIVQAVVDDNGETCLLDVPPQRLTVGERGSSSGAQLLGVEPSGTLGALQMLLTPILSTQLTCASLTHTGLLMATAS